MRRKIQPPSFEQGLALSTMIMQAINRAAQKNNLNADQIEEVINQPGMIFQLVQALLKKGKKDC